jgi:hypothetical protein
VSGAVTTRRAGAFALAPFALLFAATSLAPSDRIEASYEVERAPIVVTEPAPDGAAVTPLPDDAPHAEITDDAEVVVTEPAPAEPTTPETSVPVETTEPVATTEPVGSTPAVEPEGAPAVDGDAPTTPPTTAPPTPPTAAPPSPPTTAPPAGGGSGAERIHAGPRMIDAPVSRLD